MAGRETCGRARLTLWSGDRQILDRSSLISSLTIFNKVLNGFLKNIRSKSSSRRGPTIDKRNLGHNAFNTLIYCRYTKAMSPAEAAPPYSNPVRVHFL